MINDDASDLPQPMTEETAIVAAVAQRLADIRKDRGLSFDKLARLSGVSKGTLVQIEQQRANPNIATLCRMAVALDVSVADLIAPASDAAPVKVVAPQDHRTLWTGPKGGRAVLMAGSTGPDMINLWHWTLMPGEAFAADTHSIGTREVINVIEGVLTLTVGGEAHSVSQGATAIAHTDRAHSYANDSDRPLRFSMVVHEPRRTARE